MTRPVLVRAFLEGASIATLAELLGHEQADLEAGLRMGLIEIRDAEGGSSSQDQPAADAALAEGAAPSSKPRQARNGADSSSGRPARHAGALKRSPARKRMAADVEAAAESKFSGYPESLRDNRAETQRAVYDALTMRERTTTDIAEELQMGSGAVFQAIQKLRDKNLVVGSETTPVKWRQV